MNHPTRIALAAVAMTGFALLTSIGAARADRFDALRADAEIENGVTIVAIGDIIQDNCPGFELRRVRAAAFFWGLVNRGRDLGYTDDEITAYVENDADVARVRARAQQWMRQQGADLDEAATICAVARDEIAGETAIGRLIRER